MASNDCPEKIAEWFWDKNKTAISKEGEILIRALNKAAPGIKGVRYEELRPYIYGVKVERPKLVIETPAGTQRMTLMKIGFTHTDTSHSNDDSRINTLQDDIKRKIKKCWDIEAVCSVIFVLSIDALDTRQFFATEAEVRSRVGIQVPKKIGKTLRVPVHTEWVVTTEVFITKIRTRIDSLKKLKKTARSETKVQLAPSYVMPGSTPRIKQNEDKDVKRLTETMGNVSLDTKANTPPFPREAAPVNDETPSKNKTPISIDTDSIFGERGLRFNECYVSGVQGTFDDIEKHKESEIDVVKITESNGEIALKLMKSKKIDMAE